MINQARHRIMMVALGTQQVQLPNRTSPGVRSCKQPRKVTGNLSRKHPDYGLSPQEHMKRKAKREAGRRMYG